MKHCEDCIIYDAENGWCRGGGDRSPKDKACDHFVAADKMVKECCATCAKRLRIVCYDYRYHGCTHVSLGGYVCLAMANEGMAVWMLGANETYGCEEYLPKGMNEAKGAHLGQEKDCFTCVHSSVTDDDKLMCSIKELEVQDDWKCDEWKGE